jgi:cyclophilin family peptidyl-prolyl cis-trans isomerase
VQGGGTDDDPSGKLDWSIKNEDNRRQHWRGTIAMARTRDKDSADTHFFITIGNHPASLGLSTDWVVFGRIIEGLPNAQRLQEGDRFTKVTVEKLRDHAYVPVRTPVEDH